MSMKLHCDGCDAVVQDLGKPEQFKGVRLTDPAIRQTFSGNDYPWAFCDWSCVTVWAAKKKAAE